ncbi:T9SS type A sorting domain-containing protein [Saccharicrinis sp. GN24d3]|uniref:T9SS type A sorting domain-containing protein n=1 Tax=Saccharicrinis sp. GN24d3 TaxID=3458416 RepID=UPI004035C395
MKLFTSFLLMFGAMLLNVSLLGQVKLFYMNGYDYLPNSGTIYSCLSDGTNQEVCFNGVDHLTDIAVDYSVNPQRIYYIENGANRIRSANLDGGNIQDVITDIAGLTSIPDLFVTTSLTIDAANRKVYFTINSGKDDRIYEADMDGTNQSIVMIKQYVSFESTNEDLRSITYYGNKLYYIRSNNINFDNIYYCNTDGTDHNIFVWTMTPGISMSNPYDMAVGSGYVYWTDSGSDVIYRINIDKTSPVQIATGVTARDIAVDTEESKIYWTENITAGSSKIVQANLDGSSNVDVITTGIFTLAGLVANPEGTVSVEELNTTIRIKARCYPNPVTSNAIIEYTLVNPSDVKVSVYNISGKEVTVLINKRQPAGVHLAQMNTEKLPSGIYFCNIEVNGNRKVIKLVVSR